ncbi:hypothetical protein FFLO_02838 [Filobasidium floriforme]|uniref:Uncharacterized protein n=1 Tax=Filobasidium floriforme TaxID=5210 RepID=A0A8K0JM81_9TREE|nr:uncharacterized protein HD553DRAFT_316918 [Filobasidium floriforme]KAG7558275.1 hypothetical protein FFLO_02838 [Filobasidium floriforme]KAH8080501.1 hypothetical protein HD553DRAFT_316918 [Filobasidium floriforme]
MTSTYHLIKSHIEHLSQVHLASPLWSSQSNQILAFLRAFHTPSFSDPKPSLERAPSWKTLWGDIRWKDPADDRWWTGVDEEKLTEEVREMGVDTLRTFRMELDRFFSSQLIGENVQVNRPEEGPNPFERSSCDVAWEILQPQSDTAHFLNEIVVRLKITLRWTDDSLRRYRHKHIYREFQVNQPSQFKPALMRGNSNFPGDCAMAMAAGDQEIQHLEYASIPFVHPPAREHERPSRSFSSSVSEDTVVGPDYTDDDEKAGMTMTEIEVKAWARQFGDLDRSEKRGLALGLGEKLRLKGTTKVDVSKR